MSRTTRRTTRAPVVRLVGLLVVTVLYLGAAAPIASASHVGDDRDRGDRNDRDLGRSHGFVVDERGVTRVDHPDATWITAVGGSDGRGRIVGAYVDRRQRFHGFERDRRGFHRVDYPGAAGTVVSKINGRGQVVGSYTERRDSAPTFFEHGFMRDRRGYHRVDVPRAIQTRLYGINDAGQIVGTYVDRDGRAHGFLRETDGEIVTIDPQDAVVTQVLDIDNRGRAVGVYVDAAPSFHGFVRAADGTIEVVDAPEAADTVVYGINDRGDIVGGSRRPPLSVFTPFVRAADGTFGAVDLPDDARGGDADAFDIDDDGRIVGNYDGSSRGYVRDRDGDQTTFAAPGGDVGTTPQGVNNRGEIVGYAQDRAGAVRGFQRSTRGRFRPVSVSGAAGTMPTRINDRGDVVGVYSTTSADVSTDIRGFLLRDGRVTDIAVPEAEATYALGVDDRGAVVGWFVDDAGAQRGFRRDQRGRYETIAVPDALGTVVVDLNDRGEMVGYYIDAQGGLHGFRRDRRGTVTDIERVDRTADGPSIVLGPLPTGINDRGQIVGAYRDAQFEITGFLLDGPRFSRLRARDAFGESFALDINDRGTVVGITR
jgi:uncharacterized membrane protein